LLRRQGAAIRDLPAQYIAKHISYRQTFLIVFNQLLILRGSGICTINGKATLCTIAFVCGGETSAKFFERLLSKTIRNVDKAQQ